MAYTKKRFKSKSEFIFDIMVCIILTFIAVIIFLPFYNAVVMSFQTPKAYAENPIALFPSPISFAAYIKLFASGMLWTGYKSSLKVTVFGTIYGMSISVMAAYAFSRKSFPGKKAIFLMFIVTMFFSGGMVPKYLLIKNMGLIDSHLALILIGGVSMYNIIIIKNSFEQTPVELEEVAKIDGANDIVILLKVMLPLQGPVIATFTLFTMVSYWNEWFWSMLVLNSTTKMTLQIILRTIVNDSLRIEDYFGGDTGLETFSQGMKMATVVATMLPIMCVYPFLQKYFVKGIIVGAIKM